MTTHDWQRDPIRNETKNELKKIFDERIRGKTPDLIFSNVTHDGRKGHWLQVQFGLTADSNNAPDYKGFELKDGSRSKTSFGDWSADQYIFYSHNQCMSDPTRAQGCHKCSSSKLSRSEFFKIFGSPNPKKGNRYSWSGTVFPKVNQTNDFGQSLVVEQDLDVVAKYSFDLDKRPQKSNLVPPSLQKNDLELARWSAQSLKQKLENKFKIYGWFKCIQSNSEQKEYTKMQFGGPISFGDWIEQVRRGTVYLDSGMHDGNMRPYQNWRANNSFWDSLVEETYP